MEKVGRIQKHLEIKDGEIAEFYILSASKSHLVWLVFSHAKFSAQPVAFKSRAILFLYPYEVDPNSDLDAIHSKGNSELITVIDSISGHSYTFKLTIDEISERASLNMMEQPKSDRIFLSRKDLNGISKNMWKAISNNANSYGEKAL